MLLPPLYAIADAGLAGGLGLPVAELARAYLKAGVGLLQVRMKDAPGGPMLAVVEEIVAGARERGALVIVNDRADVARLAEADGVHVGQDDLPVPGARLLLGPGRIVGLSTHTPAQVDAALAEDIDYLAVGPVFGTSTKETGYLPVGLELVRYAARAASMRPAGPVPVVAIGGITLDTAGHVFDAGASSVAVISDLTVGGDPRERAEAWMARLRDRRSAG